MSRPPVFASKGYADALADSKDSGKVLIVDATATWCQPCQVMDRVTWVDRQVVAWIETNAIALQVDVDAEKDIARSLRIRSMPTVVVFRAGVEVDRLVGLQRPAELVSWLTGLQRGETNLDRVRKVAEANPKDMQARYTLARTLASDRRFEEATDEYVWLWGHVTEVAPPMIGVRNSYMLHEIGRLTKDHPPARARFAELRDALGSSAPATTSDEAVSDWIALTVALGEVERVLAWFDSTPRLLDEHPELERTLRLRLVPLLTDRGRWADIGRLYRDPLAALRQTHEHLEGARAHELPPEMAAMRPRMIAALERTLRENASHIVASLLAAKRDEEARAVLEEARRLLPGEETEGAIQETAQKAGVALPSGLT